MDSLKGKFLVASPMLGDTNFFRTVVLMLEHDEEGAMGLILTRPTDMTVRDVMERLEDEDENLADPDAITESIATQPIQIGGPVPGPLIALHDFLDCSESDVMAGIYIATQRSTMSRLLGSQANVRLFTGYAGWGKGQLENELEAGGWLTCDATADDVLDDPQEIWDNAVSRIGQDILNLPNHRLLPDDPSMN